MLELFYLIITCIYKFSIYIFFTLTFISMKINFSFIALFAVALISFAFTADNGKYKVNSTNSTLTWVGKKVTGEHTGNLAIKNGELEFANNKLKGGSFEIDMTSITCTDLTGEWNEKLVGHLRSDDFFSVDKYPTSKVAITKVKSKGSNKHEVTADVTIKGITHPVTFMATTQESNGVITATADVAVDRTKYDIKYGSGSFFDGLGDKMIDDEFTLSVSLKANSAM